MVVRSSSLFPYLIRRLQAKSWKQTYTKTEAYKVTNSILEYFEYFCQMSSKSIFIILSYTISKLVHFFWGTV